MKTVRVGFTVAALAVVLFTLWPTSTLRGQDTAADVESVESLSTVERIERAYQAQRDQIEPNDATGHYELGLVYFKKYKPQKSNDENLKYIAIAKVELETAAGIYHVEIDGEAFDYNVTDAESDLWAKIAGAFKDEADLAYAKLYTAQVASFKKDNRFKDPPPQKELIDLDVDERNHVMGDLTALDAVTPGHPHAKAMYKVASDAHSGAKKRLAPSYLMMAFGVIGGLGIFLLGMKNMSEGVQAVAGARLRSMIKAVTDNRFLAVGVGTGVTCIVQSSSITTVIVVGLVNSGLMALHQSIGVIMGANIGTTITGWILVLKIGKYGLPLLGVAVFVFLFSKTDRWRYIAMAVMGLGLVFFGLELMKNGFKPMRDVPEFVEAFKWFDAGTYFGVLKCALVGCVLTFIVQSSSATLGITISLAATGTIQFETAAALVLGENIGTTITAWLASIGTTTNAKRAAYAHILFNLIGVIWITAIFAWYIGLIDTFSGWVHGYRPIGLTVDMVDGNDVLFGVIITFAIASTHTIFNIANTLFFLPFVRVFARMLERFVPDKGIKETPHLSPLDMRVIESPVMGIETSRGEIIKMGRGVSKMLDWTRELIQQDEPDEALVAKVFNREKIMDNVQAEIITFLTDLLTGTVPHAIAEEGRAQLRVADEYESISDYASTILKSHLRLREHNLSLADEEITALIELHDEVGRFLALTVESFEKDEPDVIVKVHTAANAITARFKKMRDDHMDRLVRQRVDPQASMAYTAMLNAYRKVTSHAENVAEAMATEAAVTA